MSKKSIFLFLALSISLILSCSTTPVSFKIEPTSHNFGQVNIGDTATFDFVVTNKKSVDMTLTIVNFSTGEFSDISAAQGKSILAKGTLTVTVRFAPALPGGAKTDTMHVEWTDINGKTGKKDVKLKGEAVPVPKINAPTTYDFGTVGIANTATHNFNIENTGTADLILSLFNFNGNATLFSITAGGTTPVTVIPGATHTVTVQFAPIATGSFPTIFEITHNAVNAVPPATINISAAGGGGKIEFNQTSPWDFGSVKTAGAKSDIVEISNTGSIDLNISNISLSNGTVFSIDACDDSSGNPVTTPFAIPTGDFVELCLKFSPTTAGNFNDTLNIVHDGSYSASPASLSLEGVGRAPLTQTFNYTGRVQNWNVPAGFTSIDAECLGAQGGPEQNLRYNGGKGGKAVATVPVSPGSTVNIYVGGQGTTLQTSPTGGWNGGGGTAGTYPRHFPGTGGGGSDIRIGGTALTDRKLVGAGGGGAGYYGYPGEGGFGGGLIGDDGEGATFCDNAEGGTQIAGGKAGYRSGWSSQPTAGALGVGGRGLGANAGGGGGGGGYFGGGGGILNSGAGGSSYYDASGNTNKSTTQNFRTGNGQVVITY